MTPDVSRMLGRLLSAATGAADGYEIRRTIEGSVGRIVYVSDIPEIARPIFETHRSEIMRGLDVPEHRP